MWFRKGQVALNSNEDTVVRIVVVVVVVEAGVRRKKRMLRETESSGRDGSMRPSRRKRASRKVVLLLFLSLLGSFVPCEACGRVGEGGSVARKAKGCLLKNDSGENMGFEWW